jgi:lactate dehydrogenase-like 2-hydroxyacid dehydrogenase
MFNSLEGNRNSVTERARWMRLHMLINTARYQVVKTVGLVDALKSGKVQGAALYVLE